MLIFLASSLAFGFKIDVVTATFLLLTVGSHLKMRPSKSVYVLLCLVWYQFKKREKHPWRSVTFSKVAG